MMQTIFSNIYHKGYKLKRMLGRKNLNLIFFIVFFEAFLFLAVILSFNFLKGLPGRTPIFEDFFVQWDSYFYLHTAKFGYSALDKSLGFFPFLSILIRFFRYLIGGYIRAGILVSLLSYLGSLFYLYKLVFDETKKKEVAELGVKYLILAPAAFLFFTILSEGLFIFLLLGCFYYARKGKWWIVGSFGFLLSITRSLGFFIIIPIFLEYMKQQDWQIKKIRWDVLGLVLFPLGLGVYMGYNFFLTGDFLAFKYIQEKFWVHELSNPLFFLIERIRWGDLRELLNAIYTIFIYMFLGIAFWRKQISSSYFVLGILFLTMPLMSGGYSMDSMIRYSLPIFPIYIVLAKELKDKTWTRCLVNIFLAMFQGALAVLWILGYGFI